MQNRSVWCFVHCHGRYLATTQGVSFISTSNNKRQRSTSSKVKKLRAYRGFFQRDLVEAAKALEVTDENNVPNVSERSFAAKLDSLDPLKRFRSMFFYPKIQDLPKVDLTIADNGEEDAVYMCSNSLGLQPRNAQAYVNEELEKWAKWTTYGRSVGSLSWETQEHHLDSRMANLIGAKHGEVALCNGLTVNAHLGMVSFYQPTAQRHMILLERKAFPSDHYVVQSQIRLRGFDPDESMLFIEPRQGEHTIREADLLETIDRYGQSIALIWLPGIQYYTGQRFDIESITRLAHKHGCMVGFDLAHAAGNIPLRLHDWNVDFAVWCTYKYICSSHGGLGGLFVHDRFRQHDFPRLVGWWGHRYETRFNMDNQLDLYPGAPGYRLSNTPALLCAPLRASFEIFEQTTMSEVRHKSRLLTAYLETLLWRYFPATRSSNYQSADSTPHITIITPSDPESRGAQLSLVFSVSMHAVFSEMERRGVVCDTRLPNVVRVAPAPLYNSFTDVCRFVEILKESFEAAGYTLAESHTADVTV